MRLGVPGCPVGVRLLRQRAAAEEARKVAVGDQLLRRQPGDVRRRNDGCRERRGRLPRGERPR